MQKAGGIIAVICGLFAGIGGVFTLIFGATRAAFKADQVSTILDFGWGGIGFSCLVIVLGMIAMGTRSRMPAILLTLCALAGAMIGGTFVAVCLCLAAIAGVLAIIGTRSAPVAG